MQHVVLAILKQLFLEIPSVDCCNQKQPPEVFYKKAVLKYFSISTGKKPVLESLFNKVFKKSPTQVFSCEYHEIFKNTYSEYICNWLLLCNSPVLSTIIFQIHIELLFHVQLSLLRAYLT